MEKYLEINKVEAGMILKWFFCFRGYGHVECTDDMLAKRIKNHIIQIKRGQEDGKRVTENNQRK